MRKKLVQDADFPAAEGAQPADRLSPARRDPVGSRQLKGITLMDNSQYNGWRMEDWWLDK
jgi:hypothetical protein